MDKHSSQLLTSLLRDVSRSFYRTLRVLPGRVRPQISLAYLLARTTDTIADTELVTVERRLGALRALRDRILDSRTEALDLGELAGCQAAPAERILLQRCEDSLTLLRAFSHVDRKLIQAVLEIIASGQELDLLRFSKASAKQVIALQTTAELDDYTYRVAGCVGEFWTRMCRLHLFPRARLDEHQLMIDAVRFGKGLQLVNILRDLPADLRQGRCYLPSEPLAGCGLTPQDLLDPANEPRLRPFYQSLVTVAEKHLLAGWDYTQSLPRHCVRVRLACAWPLLIGRETLQLLRTNNVLDPARRLKISRKQVKSIIARSVLLYPVPSVWRGLYRPSLPGEAQPRTSIP